MNFLASPSSKSGSEDEGEDEAVPAAEAKSLVLSPPSPSKGKSGSEHESEDEVLPAAEATPLVPMALSKRKRAASTSYASTLTSKSWSSSSDSGSHAEILHEKVRRNSTEQRRS